MQEKSLNRLTSPRFEYGLFGDCLRVGAKHLIQHVKGQHRLLILFQCIVPPTVLELLEKSREPN